jgi:hypothetical protein
LATWSKQWRSSRSYRSAVSRRSTSLSINRKRGFQDLVVTIFCADTVDLLSYPTLIPPRYEAILSTGARSARITTTSRLRRAMIGFGGLGDARRRGSPTHRASSCANGKSRCVKSPGSALFRRLGAGTEVAAAGPSFPSPQ